MPPRPVYNELEQDHTTKQLIDSIRTLKADATAAATVAPCENAADGATTQNGGATIPFGTYTKTATTQDAIDRGIDPTIAADALGPSGEAKFTFAIEADVSGKVDTAILYRFRRGQKASVFGQPSFGATA